jgi:hypothetical protein
VKFKEGPLKATRRDKARGTLGVVMIAEDGEMQWVHFSRGAMVIALTGLWTANALADLVVFSDGFNTDTTGDYTWTDEGVGGDRDPANNYTYDAVNRWVVITTANNENIYLDASLSAPIQAGYFQMSFMPWQTYPTDGLVRMRLFGIEGTSNMYMWHFAHNSDLSDPGAPPPGYRAHLEKRVAGAQVVAETFIPSPTHYDLGAWHTLALSFSATAVSGYLDGQLVKTVQDPMAIPVAVNSFEIVFQQQDQYLDNILIIGEPYVDPCPAPIADAGGPYFFSHRPLMLHGSVNGEFSQAAWDLDTDGLFDDAFGLQPWISTPMVKSWGFGPGMTWEIGLQVTGLEGEVSVSMTEMNFVPLPGAALLGVIGLGCAGIRLRRQ